MLESASRATTAAPATVRPRRDFAAERAGVDLRVDATPRRLASANLHFAITAPGATQAKAARAVELSVTKYCSVRSSLIADAPVSWTIALES